VKVGPSPEWMQRRLTNAGVRSINNVVDVTNYILLETGQPLHAFDYDKLNENRIVVRTAREGETIRTIDGEVRKLTPEMLVIADAGEPVAVAGVMGGLDSEVGESTVNVFLESAYFSPTSVRRTSRVLGLQSEASARFQRGADPEMTVYAVERAAKLITELAGGEVAQGRLDEYPNPVPRREVELRYARTRVLLGAEVATEEQRGILERLGFAVVDVNERGLRVQVPTWRHDVHQEADLIEEIARLHGYESIPTTVSTVRPTERTYAPEEVALYRLRHRLVALGLTEFMNVTFTSVEDIRRAGLDGGYTDAVPLQNPLTENWAVMRTTLIPGLLGNVALNLRKGTRSLHAFEVGPVYRPSPDEVLPAQGLRLGIVMTGHAGEKHWSSPQRPFDFYDLKGDVEALLEGFGAAYEFRLTTFPVFQEGQGAEIRVGEEVVGWFGRVRREVVDAYDIDQPVFLLEADLGHLLGLERPTVAFQPLPKFPPSLRDLAVVVDAAVPAGALRETAQKAGGNLLKRVNIFDVYTGKQVPAGKKSVALSLLFQSEERTLTDADTQKAWDRILADLQQAYGAELR
jgi:phenylalanyl-tRNA synthetase beta chain